MLDEFENLKNEWQDLLFGVRRTIRYHTRRRKFFDMLGVWSNFLTIVSGGGAVFASVKSDNDPKMAAIAGGIVGMLATLDLVIGFSTRARDHHDLCKEFSRLEREITAASVSKENLVKLTNRRLEIEDDEPPILRVLNNYCHNELCRAMGKDPKYYVKIGRLQSVCKQFFDLNPAAMQTFETIEQMNAAKKAAKSPKQSQRPPVSFLG